MSRGWHHGTFCLGIHKYGCRSHPSGGLNIDMNSSGGVESKKRTAPEFESHLALLPLDFFGFFGFQQSTCKNHGIILLLNLSRWLHQLGGERSPKCRWTENKAIIAIYTTSKPLCPHLFIICQPLSNPPVLCAPELTKAGLYGVQHESVMVRSRP